MARGGDADKRKSDQGETGKGKWTRIGREKGIAEDEAEPLRPDTSPQSDIEGPLRSSKSASTSFKATRQASETLKEPSRVDESSAAECPPPKSNGSLIPSWASIPPFGKKNRGNSIDMDAASTPFQDQPTPSADSSSAGTRPRANLKSASSMPANNDPATDDSAEQADSQATQPAKAHRRTLSMGGLFFKKDSPDHEAPEAPPQRIGLEYNAGLINLGNQCFFNALLQVFFHTKVLPKILWKSYPEVPDLPEFLREEQLMSVMSEKQLSERAALSPAASGLGSESSTQLQLGIRTGPSSRAPSVAGQSDADGSSPSTGRESPSAPSASGFFGGLRVGVHTMNDFGRVSPTSCTLQDASMGQDAGSSPHSRLSTGSFSSLRPIPETGLRPATDDRQQGAPDRLLDDISQEQSSTALPNGSPIAPALIASPAHSDSRPQEGASKSSDAPSTPRASSPAGEASPASQPALPRPNKLKLMCERVRQWEVTDGLLCHAMAWVLLQMQISEKPVNPCPALCLLAQHSDLVDGEQQDVHEAFMLVRQRIGERRCAEMGAPIGGLYTGKQVIKRSCKRCSYSSEKMGEEFADISLLLNGQATTMAAALQQHCNPPKPSTECQECQKRRKEGSEKPTMLQNFVSVFQPNPNGKEHEDCMKESVTFESLPNCLSFHIIRTKHRVGANSQSFLAKDETPLSVNLSLRMWDHLAEKVKEEHSTDNPKDFDYKLFAVICHQGMQAERGHYYAICRTDQSEDSWRRFDDEKAPLPVKSLKKPGKADKDLTKRFLELDAKELREVCMCFYEKSSQPVTLKDSRVEARVKIIRQQCKALTQAQETTGGIN